MSLTTIQIGKQTREKLKHFGTKDETYDDIVNKLIEIATMYALHEDMKRILKDEEFVSLGKI
jgi:hypothetical protein